MRKKCSDGECEKTNLEEKVKRKLIKIEKKRWYTIEKNVSKMNESKKEMMLVKWNMMQLSRSLICVSFIMSWMLNICFEEKEELTNSYGVLNYFLFRHLSHIALSISSYLNMLAPL